MTQVFARYAKDMLEKQTYPEVRRSPTVARPSRPTTSPPGRSACCSASTRVFVQDARCRPMKMTSVDGAPKIAGEVTGSGTALRVRLQRRRRGDRDQPAAEGRRARRVRRPVARRGHRHRARQDRADREGLRAEREGFGRVASDQRRTANDERRVSCAARGMYQPWTGGNMDEGWTRWVLEQYEFNLTLDPQRRHPRRQAAAEVRRDHPRRPGPARDRRRATTPATIRPEYRGGIGDAGRRAACKQFVADGGTLVTLGDACDLAIEQLPIPVREPEEGADARSALRAGHDPQARGRHRSTRSATAWPPTPTASTSTARSSS